jgi:2-dehydro-3-deoxyphosphogluconate aldolase / (4S)-4-hydroxy-2-oxoglutarate aldolase
VTSASALLAKLGPVIAVVRASDPTGVLPTVDALLSAGLPSLEITLTTPNAVDLISQAVEAFGDAAIIGAGTVLTSDDVARTEAAGARFLVTPTFDADVLAEASVPVICGGFTPTEIHQAWAAGAAAVKVFPARLGGPQYLRDLHAPFPEIALVPTGGVTVAKAAQYLDAGAIAVGLGTDLVGPAMEGRPEETARRAAALVAGLRQRAAAVGA